MSMGAQAWTAPGVEVNRIENYAFMSDQRLASWPKM